MVFQRIISRLSGWTRRSSQSQKLQALNRHSAVKFSDQSRSPFSQITQKCDLFLGTPSNYRSPTSILHNAMPRFLANSVIKFSSSIHSVGPKEFETVNNGRPVENQNSGFFNGSDRRQHPVDSVRNTGYFDSLSQRLTNMDSTRPPYEPNRDTRSMNFSRGFTRDNTNDTYQNYRSGVEQNADIVHIKLMRNNTFVTVTDSKGNKKMGASAGCLAEMKGGPKVSKYSAEATAEHVGRVAKSMGLKSVVMKVNGFTFFKRKKLAILSFRDGYTHSRSDRNPIVYIEDTTRKAHNGCRLKKQRRV